MLTKEENDSIWLFGVLDFIGANEEFRKTCQRAHTMHEILLTFQNSTSVYTVGSSCEGSYIPGNNSCCGNDEPDEDFMTYDDSITVIEDLSISRGKYRYCFLAISEDTPVGYVKLQPVFLNTRLTDINLPYLQTFARENHLTLDKKKRLVLFDLPKIDSLGVFSRLKNKPAITIESGKLDVVGCFRCKTWPTIANEWLTRTRNHGWPSEDNIHEMKSFGVFIIKKGHPFSPEADLEWRIAFSLQERQLMFSLTDVQHKCYIVLKMLNRNIIKLNYVTSYRWKTCLFYILEENDKNVWRRKDLFYFVN